MLSPQNKDRLFKYRKNNIMENVKMIDDDSDGNPRVEITMNDFLK